MGLADYDNLYDGANIAKDIVINRLEKDGILTEDQAKQYRDDWQMIIVKKSWLQRFADKFFPNNKHSHMIFYLKLNE